MASDIRNRETASRYLPREMSEISTAADSKYRSITLSVCPSATSTVFHRLYRNAAPVPIATRLSMFGVSRHRLGRPSR